MNVRGASAPGKVVLSGEYAVLDGAPAICMAIDRRARVSIADIDGSLSRVTAPGFAAGVGRFETNGEGTQWQSGGPRFEIVDSVRRAINTKRRRAAAVDLDTTEFIDPASGEKIGIGSSAALVVALCAAVEGATEVATPAQEAHADLQGGVGSGADVACSLNGGLIEYRVAGRSATALQWPEGLFFRLIWTGVAARTADKLALLEASTRRASHDRLLAAAETMATIWHGEDAGQIVSHYGDYIEHLRLFSIDHRLGIFDAGHEQLRRTALAANLVYKPCGAGGGDVGIVFGTDDGALNTFTDALTADCTLIECELDNRGVSFEAANPGPSFAHTGAPA